jgi:hypothetical protein
VSVVRTFKAHNPLAAAVKGDSGLLMNTAIKSAGEQLQRMQNPMRESLRKWITEILALSAEPTPDLARLAWLANGVLGVAGACGLEGLARCGALFGRAIEVMGQGAGWRADAARLYASSLVRLLEGNAQKPEVDAVLDSLEALNRRLAETGAPVSD